MGLNVCCALDKNASFAVSHQIADVYDQAHRLVLMLIPDLIAIADLIEQLDSIFVNLQN